MRRFLQSTFLNIFLSASIWCYGPAHAQNGGPQPGPDERVFSLFLIGDAGESTAMREVNLELMRQQFDGVGDNSCLVFLGDNIYPKGLPELDHHQRQEMEQKLIPELELMKDFPGDAFIIPGNHDWDKGKRKGWDRIRYQNNFVEDYLGNANVFQPQDGCPGPVEINLSPEFTLVIVDTQWILHPWDKPREEDDCENKTAVEILVDLEDILRRNKHKKVIVATHHPMYTYGEHGGISTWKQHIFPLTDASPNLYLPLPVIGSLYPLYRKSIGNIQDTAHPKYKAMRNLLVETLSKYPHAIHVSGHEHAQQYIEKDTLHFVVSGSGSKNNTPVKQKGYAQYVQNEIGFSRVNFYANGDAWIEYWVLSKENPKGKKDFEKFLFNKPYVPPVPLEEQDISFANQTVNVFASNQYKAKRGRQRFFGKNYRDVWEQKIDVPVFDIGEERGGLEIVKRGGGQQTKSLRLEAKDEQQYVLRSVEKYPENAIPVSLRKTFAADIVQDQISASHPYAAYVIPPLADAAGIYHTNPELVYLPNDPRYGQYQEVFSNTLALYEERPDDEAENQDFFGNSEDIISTLDVLKKIRKDNDHYIDQNFVVRNRLFDMIIADWDRHDDQWRWASFDDMDDKGKYYRPIPRDRDQAFFVNEGFFPKIASRKWALPKIEGFNEEVRWPPGFMFNARYFDRSFMTEPEREEWIAIIEDLQNGITDEVIDNAIKSWPAEVYELSGERVTRVLKARRDNLKSAALEYYLFLAKEVDVVGSMKNEEFLVERLDDERTRVTVRKISKEGKIRQVMYQRTFLRSETREIRLYGLGGEDQFRIEGDVHKGPMVRIIGGEDLDQIRDESRVRGMRKKNIVYDIKSQTDIIKSKETRDRTSEKPEVNEYDRKAFQFNKVQPLLSFAFNVDDGVFLGGGVSWTKHKFRKKPYWMKHDLRGNVAFNTASFNILYDAEFIDVLGKWDIVIDANIQEPNFTTNFFGLGNDTEYDQELGIDFYRVRFSNRLTSVTLRRGIGQKSSFSIGPIWQNLKINEDTERFIGDPENGLDPETTFDRKEYWGGVAKYDIDTRDDKIFPTRGIFWENAATYMFDRLGALNDYRNLRSDFKLYLSFRLPATTVIAARVGGAHNFGEYEFFQGNQLSGILNLRGFRRTRFIGQSSFYNNIELRIKLGSFRSYVFPATFGLLGYHDVGRVWQPGESSNTWHRSAGFGVWLSPLKATVLALHFSFTKEENLPLLSFGFFF